jgi:methionyl-tRNA formyltransferase
MAGDTETAVMVMQMQEGLDTGPVAATRLVPIERDVTTGELHDTLSSAGADLIVEALAALESNGALTAVPQPLDGVTYAAKIDKAEARIDLSKPAQEVHNLVRGLSPFPGAWLDATPAGGKPERLKILRTVLAAGAGEPGQVLDDALTIACGNGAIRLLEVQRAGKRAMTADDFLRGFDISRGAILGP